MVSSSPNTFMRVMHARRGLPLISIEHEPHLPALQFQRSARSLACSAWMRCSTSSTTMPGSTSVSNWTKSPLFPSPRQTLKTRFAIAFHSSCLSAVRDVWKVRADLAGVEILDLGIRDRDEVRRAVGPGALLDLHGAIPALLHDHIVLHPLGALARMIEPGVRAAALLAHQRRAGHRLGGDEQRAHRQRFVPPRVVLAGARRAHGL